MDEGKQSRVKSAGRRIGSADVRRAVIRIPGRYYQMWPAVSPGGLINRALELPAGKTGFVEFHCTNLGLAGGPALPTDRWYVGGGTPQEGEESCAALVGAIIHEHVAPALSAARKAGLPVFHVHRRSIARKYSPSLPADERRSAPPEAFPGWRADRFEKVHGSGYLEWEGWSELDIAEPLTPRDGERVIVSGAQFDRVLREIGVVNLIYTGFYAYSSLLHGAAGIREMKFEYGYRPLLIRECTIAEECPDTLPGRRLTLAAFRFVEQQCGYTVALSDFLASVGAPIGKGPDAYRTAAKGASRLGAAPTEEGSDG